MIREFMNISNSIALHWNTPIPTDLRVTPQHLQDVF